VSARGRHVKGGFYPQAGASGGPQGGTVPASRGVTQRAGKGVRCDIPVKRQVERAKRIEKKKKEGEGAVVPGGGEKSP